MPRSEAQSDFAVVRPPAPVVIELPEIAGAVSLPRAQVRTTEAGAFATRWVMRATLLLLLALIVLCMIGPHIPAGE
jgi:hypothetical protein